MGKFEDDQLPAITMVLLQFMGSVMTLMCRTALVKGMSPRVFIFYRQVIATLVVSPIAYFSRVKSSGKSPGMGIKSFTLIFVTAFVGVAFNQNVYFEGLYLASSSAATAMGNLVPAITFLLAASMGMEKVKLRRLSSIVKIVGTCVCVGGAIAMAVMRGPKLLNADELPLVNSVLFRFLEGGDTWLLGCLLLFLSSFCWSLWLTLQVPLGICCPDFMSLSAWMCFFSAIQTGFIALFMEQDSGGWALTSSLELFCCIYAGILGSGFQFFAMSWCISRKGPLFSAMFNPLSAVITTVIACLLLHEELYTGSLLGGVTVIIGLYVVLWGKREEEKHQLNSCLNLDDANCIIKDLEQPLLLDAPNVVINDLS